MCLSCNGGCTKYSVSFIISRKSFSINDSIVLLEPILIPSGISKKILYNIFYLQVYAFFQDLPIVVTDARSIPPSSFFSIWMKSPTVWVIGFKINIQYSFLDGSGTVIFGNPLWYITVTFEVAEIILIFDKFIIKKFNF